MKNNQPDGAATSPELVPAINVRSARNGESELAERTEDAFELARLHGLDVAEGDCISEHGSGADIVGRPGIQRILEMAERGEISHLVTLQNSHMSRNYHHLRQVLTTLKYAGMTVVTGYGTNEPRAAPELVTRHLVAKQ